MKIHLISCNTSIQVINKLHKKRLQFNKLFKGVLNQLFINVNIVY